MEKKLYELFEENNRMTGPMSFKRLKGVERACLTLFYTFSEKKGEIHRPKTHGMKLLGTNRRIDVMDEDFSYLTSFSIDYLP